MTDKWIKLIDRYPENNQEVWLDTSQGIFQTLYEKWDWKDSSCPYEFSVTWKLPRPLIVYAWQPFTEIQPERSKREDSQKCEMRCSEQCGNTNTIT